MKKLIGIILALMCSITLFVGSSKAAALNHYDLEKAALSLLHPAIVKSLQSHYGGFIQFQNEKIVQIVPIQLPADAEYDSSFKATGWAYEITVKLEVLRGGLKKENVTMVFTNEFSDGDYVLKKIMIKK